MDRENALDRARKEINEADAEIARLFEKRMNAVRSVALYKKERGLPVTDESREQAVIERGAALIQTPEYRPYYVNFQKSCMEVSKSFQHRLLDGARVAYGGAEGAFADTVARRIFPDAATVAYPDFAGAYSAVEEGECDYALLPLENSFAGDVGQAMDLAFFGGLHINAVYDVKIVQDLLAKKGTELYDITTVISHPQALAQCSDFIKKHGFTTVEAASTASAAKLVSSDPRRDIAAIAGAEAGRRYGLSTLAGHINESDINTTKFAVFSQAAAHEAGENGRFILFFTVGNSAGALSRAVSCIGENGFNLIALKSRPTKSLIWDYYFFAEGEGDISSERGRSMLEQLSLCCNSVRVAGVFPREKEI